MLRRFIAAIAVSLSAILFFSGPASAVQPPPNPSVSCTTYISADGDTGIAICFNNSATKTGYAQLWVKCTSGLYTYEQDSGWYPIKKKTSIYIYQKCPSSRVKGTRYETK